MDTLTYITYIPSGVSPGDKIYFVIRFVKQATSKKVKPFMNIFEFFFNVNLIVNL